MKTFQPMTHEQMLTGIRTWLVRRVGALVIGGKRDQIDAALLRAARLGAIWERQRTLQILDGAKTHGTAAALTAVRDRITEVGVPDVVLPPKAE